MTEIGGYFGLEELIHKEYYPNLVALNTARNALLYIIKAKKIKKLYIPYYFCDCISNMCNANKIDYEYYRINKNFLPVFDKTLGKKEYILVVNYYGQIVPENALLLHDKYENIILDNTQAFFQRPIDGMDTIYSCRKFFGVPDGAYLSTDTLLNEELPTDISKDRMKHILGRYEGMASTHYSDFRLVDDSLSGQPIKLMSRLTHNILGAIDYKRVIRIRNENFNFLQEKLGKNNKLEIENVEGAFAYPFYYKDGVTIRKEMALDGIYIPTLWPNVLESISNSWLEYDYSANILPLPCDQRYNNESYTQLYSSFEVHNY